MLKVNPNIILMMGLHSFDRATSKQVDSSGMWNP